MPAPKANTTKAKAKPMTLREELIAAGKASDNKNAAPKNLDPEAVLAEIRGTIKRMDDMVDTMGDAVDSGLLRLARDMGATATQVSVMAANQAAKKAEKIAKRDGYYAAEVAKIEAAKVSTSDACGGASAASARRSAVEQDAPAPANIHPIPTPAAKPAIKGWKAPQDEKTRSKALQDGAPPADHLMRCWECFSDLPPATRSDWLGCGCPGERDRPGQPMKRFLQPGPHRNFPTRQRSKIYLCPLGDCSGAPDPKIFAELLKRFFLLDAEVMKPPSGKALETLERDERGCGYGVQIEAPSAHQLLHSIRPRDAFLVLGYTMEDICNSAKGFGFLFGEADLDKGVGLFSFARYADGVDRRSPQFLRRCGMVLCHEATHCFGVKHCVYACCLMNGSNHLEEAESRPFAVCPVDVRKIELTLNQAKLQGRDQPPVDLVARERGLIDWFVKNGLPEDAAFSRQVVSSLTGQVEPVR